MKGLIILAILAILADVMLHYATKVQPTADQLYGCTVEQQAPNGECK